MTEQSVLDIITSHDDVDRWIERADEKTVRFAHLLRLWFKTLPWKFSNGRKTSIKATYKTLRQREITLQFYKDDKHYIANIACGPTPSGRIIKTVVNLSMEACMDAIATYIAMSSHSWNSDPDVDPIPDSRPMLNTIQQSQPQWITKIIGHNRNVLRHLDNPTEEQIRLHQLRWEL